MSEALLAATLAQAAGQLHLALDAGQQSKLLAYLDLLSRWNRTYNLTAIRDPLAMMRQHIIDSLSVVGPLRARLASVMVRPRVLDVGSGAGLPGAVIAIAAPELDVVCLDSVGKKAAFIGQVAATLGQTNLSAHHGRVQDLGGPLFDVIVSRAYSSLAVFTATTQHLLAAGGRWLAMKGSPTASEFAELDDNVRFHVEPLSVPDLEAMRCIVWMERHKLSERPLLVESAQP